MSPTARACPTMHLRTHTTFTRLPRGDSYKGSHKSFEALDAAHPFLLRLFAARSSPRARRVRRAPRRGIFDAVASGTIQRVSELLKLSSRWQVVPPSRQAQLLQGQWCPWCKATTAVCRASVPSKTAPMAGGWPSSIVVFNLLHAAAIVLNKKLCMAMSRRLLLAACPLRARRRPPMPRPPVVPLRLLLLPKQAQSAAQASHPQPPPLPSSRRSGTAMGYTTTLWQLRRPSLHLPP